MSGTSATAGEIAPESAARGLARGPGLKKAAGPGKLPVAQGRLAESVDEDLALGVAARHGGKLRERTGEQVGSLALAAGGECPDGTDGRET